jgi:hypothetical protein
MRDGKEVQDAINWFKNNEIKLWSPDITEPKEIGPNLISVTAIL